MKYNKLVRDKIPEIIKFSGQTAVWHKASHKEYWQKLKEKLLEEVNEFLANDSPEELADVLEVIDAIRDEIGWDKIKQLQRKKAEERGEFLERIILDEIN